MKALFCLLALLFVLLTLIRPVEAQQVDVVSPTGRLVPYRPQRTITRYVHDTVFFYHDSIGTVREHEIEKDIIEHEVPEPITVYVTNVDSQHTSSSMKLSTNSIGMFGYTDFRGSVIAPAANLIFGPLRLWIYIGVYYTSVNHWVAWTAGLSGYAPIFEW